MQQIVALGFLVDGHQDQRGFERDRCEGVDREAARTIRSLDRDDCDPGAETAEAGAELEGVQAATPVTRACVSPGSYTISPAGDQGRVFSDIIRAASTTAGDDR